MLVEKYLISDTLQVHARETVKGILGQLRVDQASKLKNWLLGHHKTKTGIIKFGKDGSQLATEFSFTISNVIAEKGKAFRYGQFAKHCLLMTFSERASSEKSILIEQTSLSRFTAERKTDALSDHLEGDLVENISIFSCNSLTVD